MRTAAPRGRGASRGAAGGWDSGRVQEVARADRDAARRLWRPASDGRTQEEAERRLATSGANEIAAHGPPPWPLRLSHALRNPLVVLLAVLAAVSLATGDVRAATVMALLIVLGVTLRFVQEARADSAAAALRALIRVTATALRDGQPREVPLREIVLGDIVLLAAGDMVPADVRLLSAKDLFISQSSPTGESLPVEEGDTLPGVPDQAPLERANLCFLGTTVQSGTAKAVVVGPAGPTLFVAMPPTTPPPPPETALDPGLHRFPGAVVPILAL